MQTVANVQFGVKCCSGQMKQCVAGVGCLHPGGSVQRVAAVGWIPTAAAAGACGPSAVFSVAGGVALPGLICALARTQT